MLQQPLAFLLEVEHASLPEELDQLLVHCRHFPIHDGQCLGDVLAEFAGFLDLQFPGEEHDLLRGHIGQLRSGLPAGAPGDLQTDQLLAFHGQDFQICRDFLGRQGGLDLGTDSPSQFRAPGKAQGQRGWKHRSAR